MSHQALKDAIRQLSVDSENLTSANEKVKALSSAIEVANEIVKILDPSASGLRHGEDALEEIISTNTFRNSKVEEWFSFHPIYPDERLALKFFESDICEMKFYWLNDNSTKARISAGVMLTPNWEDRESTENDDYKVGIDFFLKKDAKSLLMVISDRGNLRVMEFSGRLTHTQEQILDKIAGSLSMSSRKAFHTVLWESMALSEVNKHFYQGIAHQFTVLYQHLVQSGKNREDSKLFASRLLGRLLFIWFLRKKGVIANEDKYFPKEIGDSTVYYNSLLKPLFFQTLNTPIYARKNGDLNTPYLNGGLFDAHDNDWPYEQTTFPKSYFEDLYDHLDRYNFTTDESSPDYEQVAIDPEMLGRVFESLLAEQLTDSGEQVRKAKGTFYTPREIVSYMCKESLRQYLYTELGDEKYHDGVDKLIDSPDYEWETAHSNAKRDLWPFENMTKFIPKVIGILDSLTVLDPACGSGAFPMGMLQLLTKTYERLDARFNPYETKLSIIQNTIFGVDIEPMAVEISRLRAWLAIIVDDEGQIDPLPNLDFKFICADSLMPLEKKVGLMDNPMLHSQMAEVRSKFFNARKPESKDEWRRKYYKLTASTNMFSSGREKQLASFDPFKNQHPAEFFDPDYMFGVSRFNIVIGNPPYVGEKGHKEMFDKYKNTSFGKRYYKGKMDFFYFFFHLALDNLEEKGSGAFITTNYYPTADGAITLRRDLYRRANIIKLVNFNEYKIFESALGQHNLITIFQKAELPDPEYTTNQVFVDIKGGPDSRVLSDILAKRADGVSYGKMPKSQLYDSGNNGYIRFYKESTSGGVDSVLDKIKEGSKRLSESFYVNQGVVPGAMVVTDSLLKKYPSINAVKGEPIFIFPKGEAKNLIDASDYDKIKPLYKNSDIYQYITAKEYDKELLYIDDSSSPASKTLSYLSRFKPVLSSRRECAKGLRSWYALQWPRDKKIFEGPKVVVPYRCQKNNFAYNDEIFYSATDVYFITPINESSDDSRLLKALTAILNSKLMYVWLFARGKMKGNVLELLTSPLQEIPLKDLDDQTEIKLSDLVDSIITERKADESADISDYESEINNIVYSLYGLDDTEIELIENFKI